MAIRSYRDLKVYQLSFELAVEVDKMSKRLPKHEMYEEGRQIRRSAKSIPANIAEGLGVVATKESTSVSSSMPFRRATRLGCIWISCTRPVP